MLKEKSMKKSNSKVFIHETAVVDQGATIGSSTKIWHFCHVMSGAVIGKNCVIGQNAYIGNVKIGDGVKLQNNISVYDGVIIEDDVFVGPSAVFTNVVTPRAHVERKDEYNPTKVKKGATIGANATIVCGATLGEYCFVGAGSVVTRNVPAHRVVYGSPARPKGWACRCGELLKNSFSSAKETAHEEKEEETVTSIIICPRCGDRYKLIKHIGIKGKKEEGGEPVNTDEKGRKGRIPKEELVLL